MSRISLRFVVDCLYNNHGGLPKILLTRREGEELVLAYEDILIKVMATGIDGGQVKVGIEAPRAVEIIRRELQKMRLKCFGESPLRGAITVILMVMVGAFIVSCGNATDYANEHENAAAKGSAPAKIKRTPTRIEMAKRRQAEKCHRSLKCWADKNHAAATVLCKDAIEHKVGSALKWTDGSLEQKFYRYQWADKAHHELIYAGDHLQAQNLFGAWMNQKYYCIFNPETQKVAAVNIVFGKFKN